MKRDKKKIPLGKKEMQRMLPDYIFNNLDSEDIVLFEASLPFYPDLKSELIDIQNTFKALNKEDIDEIFIQKSKNLSVKINEKLEEKRYFSLFDLVNRKFFPAISLLVILAIISTFLIIQNNDNQGVISENNQKLLNTVLNEEDFQIIIDYAKNENDLSEISLSPSEELFIPSDINIDKKIEDMYNQYLTDNLIEYFETDKDLPDNNFKSELEIIKNIEELNNDEYELLEKEIKNANI